MDATYLITADLGQVNDFTAIAVLERHNEPTGREEVVTNIAAWFDGYEHLPRYSRRPQVAGHYRIIHLERLPLGTSYVAIPGRLQAIEARIRQTWLEAVREQGRRGGDVSRYSAAHPTLSDAPVEMVVDQTGVGRPVVDLLRETGIDPVAITITGGDQVIRVARREFRVPKRELVGAIQSTLHARRLRAAEVLPDWPVLKDELTNFKARISVSGHDSYGAEDWRQGAHDDFVLSVALGVWVGEYAATA
jgi:hypothetical protein